MGQARVEAYWHGPIPTTIYLFFSFLFSFFLYFLQINASSCKLFFKYFLFIFRLIHIFFFICLESLFEINKKFSYAFNFLKGFFDSAMIFFIFYINELYF